MIFNPYFWGFLFILLGGLWLIKLSFGLNLRISKLAFWLILTACVVTVITKGFNHKILLGKNKYVSAGQFDSYSVIAGKQTLDLTQLSSADGPIEVHVLAGKCLIYIKSKSNLRIKSKSAFGVIGFPEEQKVIFGSYTYTSPRYKSSRDPLEIRVSVFAGKAEIIEK